MNFLAHIFLSGNDEEVMIGNFIADAVKGRDYLGYSDGIVKGILLHRRIDAFRPQAKSMASRHEFKFRARQTGE